MIWIILCFIALGFYVKGQKEELEQRIDEIESKLSNGDNGFYDGEYLGDEDESTESK